jgi:serine/threonine-protein kinase RsbW
MLVAGTPTTGRVVLESRFEEVARAEQEVLDTAESHGFDESACFAIKLSLEEALTNAVKHGNRFEPDKKVVMEYRISPQEAWIRISDQGGGFRPHQVPDPTLDENLEKPYGRGIMLMRAYMSDVSFSEDGRSVTMIKRRDCPLPPPGTSLPGKS